MGWPLEQGKGLSRNFRGGGSAEIETHQFLLLFSASRMGQIPGARGGKSGEEQHRASMSKICYSKCGPRSALPRSLLEMQTFSE